MFHVGRCGSTVLANMLGDHSGVHWSKEIFTRFMSNQDQHGEKLVKREIRYHRSLRRSKIFGFETKYLPNQHLSEVCVAMDIKGYIKLLKQLGFNKYIILHRKNYLRRAISAEIGKKNGYWHSKEPAKNPTKVSINISSVKTGVTDEPLLDSFRRIDENYALLQDALKEEKTLFLNYEDHILTDPNIAYEKVCDFLGLKNEHPSIRLKRINPFNYDEVLVNFEELEKLLIDTEYEWMLED